MKFIVQQRPDISLVALEGRLDADGVTEIEQPLAEIVIGRGLPTVVDMSGISFMSSLGIGLLFDNSKKLKKSGRKLVLLNPSGMVETVLKTSKMDKLMPLVYDLHEAVRIVGGDPTIGIPASTSASTAAAPESAALKKYAPNDVLKLTIKNAMSELAGLYEKANDFLVGHNVPYRSGYAINLAIEELVHNVIKYAFVDDDEHAIDIGMGIVGEQIILEIRDPGREFDPRRAPPHNPDDEDLEPGGLGIILVLDLVDSLMYRREDDKNHVRVCVHIPAEEEGELWTAPVKEPSSTEASTTEASGVSGS